MLKRLFPQQEGTAFFLNIHPKGYPFTFTFINKLKNTARKIFNSKGHKYI